MAIAIHPVAGQPGFALVEIDGISQIEHFHFTIRRQGSDRRFVGADGRWHPTPQKLSPVNLRHDAEATRFLVGPAVVNTINEEELVTLEIANAQVSEVLVWPALSRSASLGDRTNPFGNPYTRQFDNQMPVTPDRGDDSGKVVVEKPDKPIGPIQPLVDPPPVADQPPRRRWLFALAAALLVAIVVAGGYSSIDHIITPPLPVPDEMGRLAEEVRKLIKERGDLSKLVDGGQQLLGSSSAEDRKVGFAALSVAASRGSPAGQLALGKVFDPRYIGADAERRADPETAADQYNLAARGGLSVAGDELRGLCAYMRQRSDNRDGAEQGVPQPCPNE